MGITQLIYDLTKFFFDSVFHFIELIILILVLRGYFQKLHNSISKFISNVKAKYRARVASEHAYKSIAKAAYPVKGNKQNVELEKPGWMEGNTQKSPEDK